MRMVSRATVALIVGLTGSSIASSVRAQEPADTGTDEGGASTPDSIQLAFDREVFAYPSFERRNPFRPLTGEEDLGPRFEDIVLLGVVLAPRAEASIAVLGARPPGSTRDQPPTRVFRVRSGESLGNVRVLEIRRREVLFIVEGFGISDTRTLTMRRPELPPMPPAGESPAEDPSDAPEPENVGPDGADRAEVPASPLPRVRGSASWAWNAPNRDGAKVNGDWS